MDILVQEDTNEIFLIDINYMSSFQDLDHLQVEQEVRNLIMKKIKEHQNKESS